MGAAEASEEAVLAEAGNCRILSKFRIVEFCINFKISKFGCWYRKTARVAYHCPRSLVCARGVELGGKRGAVAA